MVAVPARHPLLKHKRIPLEEMMRYPLVLCDPLACEGHARQVERVLRQLLPEDLQWKGSGGHLIITGESGRKQRFNTTGSIIDASNGKGIARATVFEVRRSNAVTTSDQGDFSLMLSGELDRTPVRISRHGYRDTVVFILRDAAAALPLESAIFCKKSSKTFSKIP